MTKQRIHLEKSQFVQDPRTKAAFALLCSIMYVFESDDLEATVKHKDKIYHFQISEVKQEAGKRPGT